MQKYCSILILALLLPILPFAQITGLSLAFGYEEFRAPFLDATDINVVSGQKVYRTRLNFELGYEHVYQRGFLVRSRFALGFDKIPRQTLIRKNNLLPSLWRFDGGTAISFLQDLGYWTPLGESKFSLSLGAGFGLGLVVDGGGWIDGIQSRSQGDPLDQSALMQFSEFGVMMQPFVSINYQPIDHFMIGLEQRHELSGYFVGLNIQYYYYDGTNDFSSALLDWGSTDGSRTIHYMPPLVRVAVIF